MAILQHQQVFTARLALDASLTAAIAACQLAGAACQPYVDRLLELKRDVSRASQRAEHAGGR